MIENLETIAALIISISIASERLVEIIKGVIPWLNNENPDPVIEGRRKAILQLLAVLSGILTAFLANSALEPTKQMEVGNFLVIGLLASGGSGFWNAILGYLLQAKELKKQEVRSAQEN